jgi:hypothetical protein
MLESLEEFYVHLICGTLYSFFIYVLTIVDSAESSMNNSHPVKCVECEVFPIVGARWRSLTRDEDFVKKI